MGDKNLNSKKITIIAIILLILICIIATVVFLKDRGTTEATDQIAANGQQAAGENSNNEPSNNESTRIQENTNQPITQETTTQTTESQDTQTDSSVQTVVDSSTSTSTTGTTTTAATPTTTTTTTTQTTNDATTAITQTVETTATENIDIQYQTLGMPLTTFSNVAINMPQLETELKVKENLVGKDQNIEYTITIANSSTVDAKGIIVSNIIPEGTTFSSASNDGTYNEETKQVIWKVDVNNGESITLTLILVNNNGTVGDIITNQAVVDGEETNSIEVTVKDITPPALVVDTVNENGYSNTENPQIHATDESPFEIVVKLNGNEVRRDQATQNENGEYSSWFGIWYLEDGEYEVTATDIAGNTKTISFILDRVAPTMTIDGLNNGYTSTPNVNVQDANSFITEILQNGEVIHGNIIPDEVAEGYKDRFDISWLGEEEFTVRATDMAGNVTEMTFVVDKTEPALVVDTVNENGYSNTENPQIHATDKNPFEIVVKLNGEEVRRDQATQNESGEYSSWFGIWYLEDGEYEVTATDIAGNTKTISFILDRKAPQYKSIGILNDTHYNKGEDITVANTGDRIRLRVSFAELLAVNPTVEIIGEDGTITEVKCTYREPSSNETTFMYMADFTIKEEMNLPEGKLQFRISNYADAAGNVGEELTQENINETAYPGVVYDTIAPEHKKVGIFNRSHFEEGDTKVATTGDLVRLFVSFPEMLAVEPTAKIYGEDGKVTEFTLKYDSQAKWYSHDFTIKEEMNLPEGEIKFEISGYADAAGNVGTILTNDNATMSENYSKLVYDTVAPVSTNLGIARNKGANDTRDQGFAKVGDSVRVLISFAEKLAVEPTVEIFGNVYTATYREDSSNEAANSYYYMADIPLTADMTEGQIAFKVYGYKDAAGNEGEILTQDNTTDSRFLKVIYDKTEPSIEPTADSVGTEGNYSKIGFTVTDNNGVASYELNGETLIITNGEVSYEDLKDYLNEGANTVVASDKAGNTATFKFNYDSIKPTADFVRIQNLTQPDNQQYAKVGDKIWLYVKIPNEQLSVLPKITINNTDAKVFVNEVNTTYNYTKYVGEMIMTEDMAEGKIQFKVSGYTDLAGNVGDDITSTTDGSSIIFDKTIPTVTVKGDSPITIEAGTEYKDAGATVTDNDGTNIENYEFTYANYYADPNSKNVTESRLTEINTRKTGLYKIAYIHR